MNNSTACDPTASMCPPASPDNSGNPPPPPPDQGPLVQIGNDFGIFTTIGLCLLGTLQLTSAIITYTGELTSHSISTAPYNYEFMMTLINGIFGVADFVVAAILPQIPVMETR